MSALSPRVAEQFREIGAPVVVEARDWGFLKSTVPTIMIEAGFMTHPVERRLVTTAAYHDTLALTIVAAVSQFLGR